MTRRFARWLGTPLFTGLARPVTLSLVKTTAFPSGILELFYEPAGDRPVQGRDPGQPVPGARAA